MYGDEPAFPVTEPNKPHPIAFTGLTKREYLAAEAMKGLLASGRDAFNLAYSDEKARYTAYRARVMADQMVEELANAPDEDYEEP